MSRKMESREIFVIFISNCCSRYRLCDSCSCRCEGAFEDGETKEWNVESFEKAKASLTDHKKNIYFETIAEYFGFIKSSWEKKVEEYEGFEYTARNDTTYRVNDWIDFYDE